jgi:hypothetical protein
MFLDLLISTGSYLGDQFGDKKMVSNLAKEKGEGSCPTDQSGDYTNIQKKPTLADSLPLRYPLFPSLASVRGSSPTKNEGASRFAICASPHFFKPSLGESNVLFEIQVVSYFKIRHLLKFSNLCLSDFKIRQIIDILRLSLSNFYETDSSRAPG